MIENINLNFKISYPIPKKNLEPPLQKEAAEPTTIVKYKSCSLFNRSEATFL